MERQNITIQAYITNPDSVRQTTIQLEERLAEQTKLHRLASEKEREAKELKIKAKGK